MFSALSKFTIFNKTCSVPSKLVFSFTRLNVSMYNFYLYTLFSKSKKLKYSISILNILVGYIQTVLQALDQTHFISLTF